MTEKRTKHLPPVRITPSGWQAVDDHRGAWTVSEYMRQALALAIRSGLRGPSA